VVVRAARQVSQEGDSQDTALQRGEAGSDARHHLGGHCWIHVELGGTARIGVAQAFADTVRKVTEVELPAEGDYLEQGSVCARLLTADGRSHTLWSPLSGSVLELNKKLRENPNLSREDPAGEGWLVRLDPGHLEEELKGLDLG
jgi:glycine cleavage system H lipoate-binding protein